MVDVAPWQACSLDILRRGTGSQNSEALLNRHELQGSDGTFREEHMQLSEVEGRAVQPDWVGGRSLDWDGGDRFMNHARNKFCSWFSRFSSFPKKKYCILLKKKDVQLASWAG